jgi:hypothetical protein
LFADAAQTGGKSACQSRDNCTCQTYHDFFSCRSRPCAETTLRVKSHCKQLAEIQQDFPPQIARLLYLLTLLRARQLNLSRITTLLCHHIRKIRLGCLHRTVPEVLAEVVDPAAVLEPPNSELMT